MGICEQVFEDSSEIASARISSSYRKSMKGTKFKSNLQTASIKNNSLRNISDDNSEALKLENKVNGCHVTFVWDDEKETSDTSDNSNNNKGNMSHKKNKKTKFHWNCYF
jgi:hypothetical protein